MIIAVMSDSHDNIWNLRKALAIIGHSHAFMQKEIGRTRLLNPGELMGKDGRPGFCIVETDTWSIQRIEII